MTKVAKMDDSTDDEAVVATYMLLRIMQEKRKLKEPFGCDLL